VAARLFAVTAYVLGAWGQAALSAYVLLSGLKLWPRGEPAPGLAPWLVDAGWLALFALQHSGMARQRFKGWLRAPLERSIYVAASGVVTLVQPLIWQPLPGELLWDGPAWIVAISLTAALASGVYCLTYDHLGFMGLRQAGIGAPLYPNGTLHTSGPYRWVRHPLMLSMLVFLWAQPAMPPELGLLNGGLTLYVLVAIRFEERDLIRQFGEEYEVYRRRVPAIVPWRFPSG
jgi:protein-S-isoprenylcysteine O-methyltransferase Ste14